MPLHPNIKRLTSSMEVQETRHFLNMFTAYSGRAARSNGEICIVGQLTNSAAIKNDIAKILHVAS
jgi:hypothetical protein